MSRILAINLNPTFQQSFFYRSFTKDDVNRAYAHNEQIAGKGFNLVRILSLLNDKAVYLSHLGKDRFHEVENECQKLGIEMAYALNDGPMRTCVTALESDSGQTTEFTCDAAPISSPEVEAQIRILFENLICQKDIQWLIIAGTQAPGYSKSLFADMVKRADELGKKAVLDICDGNLLSCMEHHPAIVKPNRKEFERTFSITGADDQTFEEKVRQISKKHGSTLVITCGDRGAYVANQKEYLNGEWLPVAEYVEHPVNATGCGDVFTAAMTHSLANGKTLAEAVLFGSQCAAARVKRMEVGL
ncbi:MAG: PfkB family carbohydrate kinase [Sphaerochaetaceae bacterium]|nr:PfkB family carbohydrate kinase [Sphaerochaetaceae bacterium]